MFTWIYHALLALVLIASLTFILGDEEQQVGQRITQAASEAAQVDVALSDIDLSSFSDGGKLDGLVLRNPAGYSSAYAIALRDVDIWIDDSAQNSADVVLETVDVGRVSITYDMQDGVSNIRAIDGNVQAFFASIAGNNTASRENTIAIRNLYIRKGLISITQSAGSHKKTYLSLPAIHLSNIGVQEGGVNSEVLAAQLLTELNEEIARRVVLSEFAALRQDAKRILAVEQVSMTPSSFYQAVSSSSF